MLSEKGLRPNIITVFSRSNKDNGIHNNKNLKETFRRKTEDIKFCDSISASVQFIDEEETFFPWPSGFKRAQPLSINDFVKGEITFIPLALGEHPDHLACFDAYSKLKYKPGFLWYEDLPYAVKIGPDEDSKISRKRLGSNVKSLSVILPSATAKGAPRHSTRGTHRREAACPGTVAWAICG